MKPVIKFLLFLIPAFFLCQFIVSQNPFKPSSFPARSYIPERIILLERKYPPVLLKISEKQIFNGVIKRDTSTELINTRIMRIRRDSIYFESAGFRFHDVESLDISNNRHYRKSDSLNWRVTFPPEDIYHDRKTYSSYMKEMTLQFKQDKISARSCRSFNNMLKLNITKIANAEIAVDYERRISKQWSVEIETGYQFAGANTMGDDFFMGLYPLYKYSGVNIVAGPKFYPGKIVYLQLIVIYHYLDMDLSRTKFATPGRSYGLQYQYRNDIGGGLRFGVMTRAFHSLVIDSYIGIGLKACLVNQFIYGTYAEDDSMNYFFWYNTDHSADHNHVTLLMPVINAGIKIGVGF